MGFEPRFIGLMLNFTLLKPLYGTITFVELSMAPTSCITENLACLSAHFLNISECVSTLTGSEISLEFSGVSAFKPMLHSINADIDRCFTDKNGHNVLALLW